MRFAAAWLFILALLAGAPIPALAHHSLNGVYERSSNTALEGTVREFRYVNPHPVLVIDVAVAGDEGGASEETDARDEGDPGDVESWELEMDNRGELSRIGLSAETFKPGERVLVRGSRALNGGRTLYLRRLDRSADGFWYEQRGSTPYAGVSKP